MRSIILVLLASALPMRQVHAQFPMEIVDTIVWNDDELLVIITASFAYGSGQTCPPFDDELTFSPGEVRVSTYYNTTGPWPAFFCARTDTVVIPDPTPDHCNLIIAHNALVDPDMDTIPFGTVDTLLICATGVVSAQQESGFRVWPNPFTDRIWIEPADREVTLSITLTDAKGRILQHQRIHNSASRIELYTPDLPVGSYQISINTTRERQTYLLMKE